MKTLHGPLEVSSPRHQVHLILGEEKEREECSHGGPMARDSRKREVTTGGGQLPKETIQ